jgi:DNA-binding NarL/FixJ family response regulator
VTAIRVLLADDHPVVREGLRGMLAAEPDIEVVGEAASGNEAVALAGRLPEPLSARETEVLALVARGLTNAQIGRRLHISEATVKTFLLRACGKLGVSGRTAAVTRAIETGALPARQ